MKLDEIQTNLQAVIGGVVLFTALAPTVVLIDDGLQNKAMENALQDVGLVILVMQPQAVSIDDSVRGAVKIDYSTAVWLRTNPKVQLGNDPKWNVLLCERKILEAVLPWSRSRSDFGFHVNRDSPPETDWFDAGNMSRLIRFCTGVHFH